MTVWQGCRNSDIPTIVLLLYESLRLNAEAQGAELALGAAAVWEFLWVSGSALVFQSQWPLLWAWAAELGLRFQLALGSESTWVLELDQEVFTKCPPRRYRQTRNVGGRLAKVFDGPGTIVITRAIAQIWAENGEIRPALLSFLIFSILNMK
jgi:hypothetical protein